MILPKTSLKGCKSSVFGSSVYIRCYTDTVVGSGHWKYLTENDMGILEKDDNGLSGDKYVERHIHLL